MLNIRCGEVLGRGSGSLGLARGDKYAQTSVAGLLSALHVNAYV